MIQSIEASRETTGAILKGENALVTGSGSGLGRAIAEALARAGADVVIHDRSEEAPAQFGESKDLSAVSREIAALGVRTAGVTGDVSDEEAVRRLVANAEEALGPI